MLFRGKLFSAAFAALLAIAAGGCSPSDQSAADEEKEFHFEQGNNCFNSMDYPGAVEAFREALEVNPHSAQAHYRLAQLFDTKQPDPAAAIFHYNEYLRLNPHAENAAVIRDRIGACKQQLAADVLTIPTAPAAMRQIEYLTQTNNALKLQVAQLQGDKKNLNDYIATLQAAAQPQPQHNPAPPLGSPGYVTPLPGDNYHYQQNPTAHGNPSPPPAQAHSYVVKPSDTLAAIARRNGVSLSSLKAANPGVNPQKLRVGQTLNLP
jgi:LysM repeat protein